MVERRGSGEANNGDYLPLLLGSNRGRYCLPVQRRAPHHQLGLEHNKLASKRVGAFLKLQKKLHGRLAHKLAVLVYGRELRLYHGSKGLVAETR